MRTDLICIGTEYLTGTIPEPDQYYLAARLAELDANLRCLKIAGDDPEDVGKVMEDSARESDILIVTGGIGYGKNPCFQKIFSRLLNKKEVFSEEAYVWMSETVAEKKLQISDEDVRALAVFPQDAMLLKNRRGLMPGYILENNGKSLVALPGTSTEIREMFEDEIVGFLYKTISLGESDIRIDLKPGVSADEVRERLGTLTENDNPEISILGLDEHCTVRIHAIGPTTGDARILANLMASDCCHRLQEGTIARVTGDAQ